jgi:hypothetical protein
MFTMFEACYLNLLCIDVLMTIYWNCQLSVGGVVARGRGTRGASGGGEGGEAT